MDKIMNIAENLDNLRDEVQSLRAQYGHDKGIYCTAMCNWVNS